MENQNNPRLDLVPVGGVDSEVSCSKCPSACCRAGVVLKLSVEEARTLREAGTELEKLPNGNRWLGRKSYLLASTCGNLVIDPETGATSCKIWDTEKYPRVCRDFPMGGYWCVVIQGWRIRRGEDTEI